MRTRRRYILRGFVIGGLVGITFSVSLLLLAAIGLEVRPVFEALFSMAGMFALAMKGDNWTGQEPPAVRMLPVAATVVVHASVCATLGALVAVVRHVWGRSSKYSDEAA
jgi:hypothetical protein